MRVPADYLAKIQATYPDLPFHSLDFNQDGMVNDLVIVNNEVACRFPKHDWASDALLHEAQVLQLVRSRVDLAVPHFDVLQPDFASYRFLQGVPLTRTVLLRMSASQRTRVLADFGHFLSQLHGITPAEAVSASAGLRPSDANRSSADWVDFYGQVESELFPLLLRHQRDWVRDHFGPVLRGELDLEFAPALIHGDLGVYHVLYDDIGGHLSGVIDFGTAGIGDPATDLAALLDGWGETLVLGLGASYPGLRGLLDRARFWVGTVGLQWALNGVRRDDKSLLLAHLGGARDVHPVGSPPASPEGMA